MTEYRPFLLSKYQKAMLTNMGISPWQLRSQIDSDSELTSSTKLAEKLDTHAESPSISQNQKQAGLERLKQQLTVKTTSLSNRVLLCFSQDYSSVQWVKDVFILLDLTPEMVHFAADANLNEFTNYKFAWQIGDSFHYDNRVLTTPPLTQFNQWQIKKALWNLVQNTSLFNNEG